MALSEDEEIAAAWTGPVRSAMSRLDPGQVEALENARDALGALDESIRADQSQRSRL